MQFLINNSYYFQVGSEIFHEVIGIPMASGPASFFANLFVFQESELLKSINNDNYGVEKEFCSILRFINDLIIINDENKLKIINMKSTQLN